MRKTMPFLLLLFCIPWLAVAPERSGERAPIIRKDKDYALFFAVHQYEDSQLTDLPNTVKNAREIEKVLKDKYAFETEFIENPKLDDIEQKLEEYRWKFASGAFPKDGQLLVFFSGHGVQEYNNGYFLPADADPDRILRTGLSYNTWRPFISEFSCQHILVAVDACYSVTFDPNWKSMKTPKFERVGEMDEADRVLSNHKDYPARIFFTSDSQEDVVPGRSNFTRKFLEGLSKLQYKGAFVTSSELFANYIKLAQPAPRGAEFEGDDPRSSFLFFPSTTIKTDPLRYEQRQRDMDAYAALQANPTISGCQQYLADFPQGNFRGEVTQTALQLQDEQEWQFASLKNTVESYQGYRERFPNGKYAREARSRADNPKQAAKVQPETSRPSAKPPDNMVFIQGGSFEMGDSFGDGGSSEKPAHTVTVSDFYLGIHETTFDEYDVFCEATGREKPNDQGWGRGRRPVIKVNWYDAIEYCNWRSRKELLQEVYQIDKSRKDPSNSNQYDDKKWIVTVNWNANGYRLPTEAEWEFAARSRGKKEKWAGTSDESSLASYSNYSEEGGKDGHEYTAPVGSLRANSAGLHDMSGNVWEWCWDWYDSGYYEKSKNSRDPRGPDSGSLRVYRGGSWSSAPANARCADRYGPTLDGRNSNLGFRLARAVR